MNSYNQDQQTHLNATTVNIDEYLLQIDPFFLLHVPPVSLTADRRPRFVIIFLSKGESRIFDDTRHGGLTNVTRFGDPGLSQWVFNINFLNDLRNSGCVRIGFTIRD